MRRFAAMTQLGGLVMSPRSLPGALAPFHRATSGADLMDSFEWNKIAGAVLGTLIFVLVVKFGTEALFEVEKPAKPGYVVEGVTEEASSASTAPVEEAIPDWGTV